MAKQSFEKFLTANDTGESGTHQAGIHIPKSEIEFLEFLPPLDPTVKNPDTWINFVDDTGCEWKFRYIYYNNKRHDEGGTRDEYRLTHTTKFFRAIGARSGDLLTVSREGNQPSYQITVSPADRVEDGTSRGGLTTKIQLRGWRRVH